jgi:DNA-binding winged helix-turn-helix (wHTH) protein
MIYTFEGHSLDTERRELRRGDDILAVEPQVFDLLQCLIGHRGRVVTKDELLAEVWKGRIVSESTLSSRIAALRHAVGDSGEHQCLIRTIARKGFRFVGVVREEAEREDVGALESARPVRRNDSAGESPSESIPESAPAAVVPEPPGLKPFAPPGVPPTLLGRDDDLIALDHLLAQHRHVTVLGAGGIGKTSLALAAAHARRRAQRDGVAWVDLSSIS